jgi:hypothetical protein
VSSAIGTLNAARFHSWSSALDGSRGAAAGLAMDGPAFKALDVRAMSISEAESASQRGDSHGRARGLAKLNPIFSCHPLGNVRVAAHFRRYTAVSPRNGHVGPRQTLRLPRCKRHLVRSKSSLYSAFTLRLFRYKFWGPRIARALEEELQHHPRSANTPPVIVNAASQEYWRAVQEQLSPGTRVVTVLFPGPSV